MAEPLPQGDDVGALEKARRSLYGSTAPVADFSGSSSVHASRELPHAWEPPPQKDMSHHPHVRLAALFFGGALFFFLVAGGIATYLLYYGGNSVSTNNVDLGVQGPTTVAGGDTVPLALSITNRNPTPIQNATLDIAFPNGTRSAEDVLQDYPRYTENLGTIAPGQTVTRSVKAVVFGGEGQALLIPVSLSFGTSNSNAVFVKKTNYGLSLTSSPLSVSVVAPSETVSGQPVTLKLSVRSNATTPIGNVVLLASYPFGFSLASTSPASQNGTFTLGTLKAGESRNITLTGALTGNQNDTRAFHFTIGTAKSAQDSTLAISYLTQEADVAITAPFITTTLALNGSNQSPVVLNPGSHVAATLSYVNTLATAVGNAEIDVQIVGGSVDYSTVKTTTGFYRSSDHTIVFARDTDPTLASLQGGASGLGAFSFSLLSSGAGLRDPSITFTTSVSGTRVGQANVPERVVASQTVTAKVASAITFTAKALHKSGPFNDGGPVPPKANTPTTYTVVWDLKNPGNAIADASVSTILPSYVSYPGIATPTTGVSYNSSTRTVTWTPGDLATGSSFEAAFQVVLTPSSSQHGSAPSLTSSANFGGYDRFAGVQISSSVDPVNTETTGDSGYLPTDANVQ